MTTAIAKYQPQTFSEIMEVGQVLAASKFFSDAVGEAQAVAKILAGQELGFGPMASMTGINIIKGRVTLSANLMAAAVKRTGKYSYVVLEHTDQKCRIEFSENGKRIGESEFTMQDAAKAGLAGGDNWRKFPKNMLFARALSNGVRWHCPDILGGPVYTPDEFDMPTDEDGNVIEGHYQDAPPVIVEDDPPAPVYTTPAPEPEPKKKSRAKSGESRYLTPEEGAELVQFAHERGVFGDHLLEAIQADRLASFMAFEPLDAGCAMIAAWADANPDKIEAGEPISEEA